VTLRRLAVSTLFCAVALAAFDGCALAYPQFQFSSGTTRCNQCHYSPAGGGLITSWGRDESSDTISSFGGNGGFLHGAWSPPSWLALGADFRFAATRNDDGSTQSPRGALFPMQGDLYARVAFSDSFSLYLQGGARGEVRPQDDSWSGRAATTLDRFISREHYLMWRPSATGPYARIGRYYAPYGIRFVEHIYYVRRFLGFNLYDETYTASGGYVGEDWEVHVSAFTPPPSAFPNALRAVGARESGGAAYFERRLAGMAAIGAQARVGLGAEASRYMAGAVGKLWLEPAKLLFLAQADIVRHQVAAGGGINQFVSYVGASVFPIRGVMAGIAYERFQEDLSLRRTGHNAYDLQASWFPLAHFELLLLGRYQTIGSGASDGPATSLVMCQLHYYL
jgi:hypothetical protein